MGKEEIAHNEQFLLFPQCFQHNQITVSAFAHIFDIISFFGVESEEPKIDVSGKVLRASSGCRRRLISLSHMELSQIELISRNWRRFAVCVDVTGEGD